MTRTIFVLLAFLFVGGVCAIAGAALTGGTTTWYGFVRACDGSDGACPTGATATGDGDLLVEDALEVDGATDLDGTLAVAGAFTFAGGVVGPWELHTDSDTMTDADCGGTHAIATDAKTFTLQAVSSSNAGCALQFINTGTAGAVLLDISPNASDAIYGSCNATVSLVTFSGTDDADIGNTKASALKGDNITLVSDGSTGWFVTDCNGIWANN